MSDPVYVDKKHYDALLKSYGNVVYDRRALQNAWNQLKERSKRFDDRVLDDIHRFDTLEEENAYLTGAFNALLAIRYTIEELEDKCHVETGCKQNSL